jgi:transcription initiation factor TFIIIB Brf1 subunit/transcription initiation factor TFIIB
MKCKWCGSERNLIYLNTSRTKTICLQCKIVEENIQIREEIKK